MGIQKTDRQIVTKTERQLASGRLKVSKYLDERLYEKALQLIQTLAIAQNEFNQEYVDPELEDDLSRISSEVIPWKSDAERKREKREVLFLDGFGIDRRGLSYIYIKALLEKGYHVIYVVDDDRKEFIRQTLSLLEKKGGEVVFLHRKGFVETAQTISKLVVDYNFAKAFLYITPYDVASIMAFISWAGIVERYQINLTDHAFWIGARAFDYSLEFRDYGGYISKNYRGIDGEKIFVQPYYPKINDDTEFQGFPFEKNDSDFVIFSGGSIYKTIDKDMTYYKMVDRILSENPNVIFWFASQPNARFDYGMDELKKRYPTRVYHTSERSDLFQLMHRVDLYLSTYPMVGGLMTQYAARTGVIPLTLVDNYDDASGLLLNQKELDCEYQTIDEVVGEANRLIRDRGYREAKEQLLQSSLINESEYADNLYDILENHHSKYPEYHDTYDTSSFLKPYITRFGYRGYERVYSSYQNLKNFTLNPFLYIHYAVISGKISYVASRLWEKAKKKLNR